jgi:hypothetical protein
MLNRRGESGHACLVPNFRGNGFQFFPFKHVIGLSYIAFTMLSYIPSILVLLELLS